MKVVMLDDVSERLTQFKRTYPGHEVYFAMDVDSMIALLERYTFGVISLDNDLGDKMKEGKEVAKYLFYHPDNPNHKATIIIHSWNAVASREMANCLPNAVLMPFNGRRVIT